MHVFFVFVFYVLVFIERVMLIVLFVKPDRLTIQAIGARMPHGTQIVNIVIAVAYDEFNNFVFLNGGFEAIPFFKFFQSYTAYRNFTFILFINGVFVKP